MIKLMIISKLMKSNCYRPKSCLDINQINQKIQNLKNQRIWSSLKGLTLKNQINLKRQILQRQIILPT